MISRVRIGNLGRIVTGNTPPRNKPEYYGTYTPFIKATDINESSKYTYSPEEYYSELGHQKYIKSLIPKGSTCVVTIGSIGQKMTMAHCDCFINQAMNAIIPSSEYNPEYVYYVVKNNIHKLKSLDSGTASGRENVSKSAFSNLEIDVILNLSVQRKIGTILSSYDALIENNQKQIKLLEEAAQRLYREWFVDLRFPGYETTPVVDGVPEGWERVEVGDCIAKVARTKQVMTAELLEVGKIPVIDQSRNFIAGYTNDEETIVGLDIPVIVFGDHTRVLKYIQFPFAKGADGTQLIVTNNEKMPQSLLYCSLVNVDLSNYHYARHFKYLKAEEILLPPLSVAYRFNGVATSLFKQVQMLRDKCKLAAEARDRLLPKLMSGEVEA